ncbi:hypothetical protein AB0I81_13335 [Nonomuraea sp. NPDC050404]|uniref:hypothetical protein n=1 Tax=Nonomuraea sp. NPDC050404 TaxID=3155783 RepID=UPI00340C6585
MNRAKTIGAAALVAAAFVATVPGVAYADPPPTDCDSGFVVDGMGSTWAKCKKGSGYVAAVATCANAAGKTTTDTSEWVPVGQWTFAFCPRTHPREKAHTYRVKTY